MSCELRGAMSSGHLKLTDEKIVFLHSKTGRKDAIVAGDIDIVNWQRIAGVWGIRIFTKDGQLHRFAGFKEAERDRVAKHFSTSFNLEMLDRELSVKGWNWGTASFNGSVLNFEVGKHDAFEIPLPYVSNCSAAKNEVTVEFAANDEAPVNLSELRFHIPAVEIVGDEDPIEAFKDQIMSKANIVTATGGKDMASFREIHSLSPRGRYDIKFYPTFFHLHGKTFDYKITVSNVIRLFLLPHKDQRQVFFCVNLDPPIKQGQTRYHYLVLSFMQDEETELELDIGEEELQEKYEGKLEKEMKGPTFEILSKLMKVICGRKVTVPGSFKGHSNTPAISCSYKAASGFVYPLERGFIFVYKPPIFIKYEDIKNVNFARSGGSNRSFDIEIHTRGDSSYTFSSIEKEEYHKLFDFLKSKKINVKSTGKMDATSIQLGGDIDHNLEKVKADAESDSENSSMSSDDEEFNPDTLEAKDAKEEYDSDPSDTGSENEEELTGSDSETERKRTERAEKAKKKAERKATSKPSSGGGERRDKKKKLTKLPGQPKKPMSGYFMWLQAAGREKINAEFPGLKVTEVGKKAGEMWREMGDSDKKEWEEKVKEAKEQYEKDYKEWLENGGEEAMKEAKKAAKKASKVGADKPAKSPKKSSSSKAKAAPTTGGTGGGFKSKEYIDDSDSGSDAGDKKKSSDKDDSDAEMKSESGGGSD